MKYRYKNTQAISSHRLNIKNSKPKNNVPKVYRQPVLKVYLNTSIQNLYISRSCAYDAIVSGDKM